jgi:hypothetical protein
VCLNVYACKLECEQATITRMSKRSYYHERELEYVIGTVTVFISVRLIFRERFGTKRESAVKFPDVYNNRSLSPCDNACVLIHSCVEIVREKSRASKRVCM